MAGFWLAGPSGEYPVHGSGETSGCGPHGRNHPDVDGQPNTELSYANTNLFGSLKKVLAQQAPIAVVYFSEPISAAGQDRRHLSALARASIALSLGLTR